MSTEEKNQQALDYILENLKSDLADCLKKNNGMQEEELTAKLRDICKTTIFPKMPKITVSGFEVTASGFELSEVEIKENKVLSISVAFKDPSPILRKLFEEENND